ncbi:hypothetical protein V6Z12_D01G220900 [Gossypium hirsutum]|uniref:Uncharacterized protein n=1 Tax=Gossypium tomentosum TaxID=34277 RepID=A0A5D2MD99_GOSTO|nr:hypothetical protein ES332_D01G237200v1 [Gossypium tomentosum]
MREKKSWSFPKLESDGGEGPITTDLRADSGVRRAWGKHVAVATKAVAVAGLRATEDLGAAHLGFLLAEIF